MKIGIIRLKIINFAARGHVTAILSPNYCNIGLMCVQQMSGEDFMKIQKESNDGKNG